MKKGKENPQLVELIIRLVCQNFECTHEQIKSSIDHSDAKDALVFLLKEEARMPLKAIKKATGIGSDASIYHYSKRLQQSLESDGALKSKVNAIRAEMLAASISEDQAVSTPGGPERSGSARLAAKGRFDKTIARYCTPEVLFSSDSASLVKKARLASIYDLWSVQDVSPDLIGQELGLPVSAVFAAIGEAVVLIKGKDPYLKALFKP